MHGMRSGQMLGVGPPAQSRKSGGLGAQLVLPAALPECPRMDMDTLALLNRWDRITERLCADQPVDEPGFSLALVKDGLALRSVHHGMAELAWSRPLDGATRYYLASESKPWVAALVLEAVAEGRLDLNADLRPTLPALRACDQPVCAGHLLRHCSGIDDYLYLWQAQLSHHAQDVVSQAQALALIERTGEQSFPPGSRFDYSNSNYVLLAEWLQQDSHQSLAELAQARFFGPWGMLQTSFENDPLCVLPRRARSYGRLNCESAGWQERPVALATWGDGGLWSTLDDLVLAEGHWQADWRAHGARSLLGRCAAEDDRFAPAGQPYRYGLEVVEHAGLRMLFHGGAYAGFTSLILRCPAQCLSLVLLSNREGFALSERQWLQWLWPVGID